MSVINSTTGLPISITGLSANVISDELVNKFVSLVEVIGEHCIWKGSVEKKGGYGCFSRKYLPPIRAHIFAWILRNWEIPKGMDVHHKCKVRLCVNVEHLELVPHNNHTDSPNQTKSHCINGHEYTKENTQLYIRKDGRVYRVCRICHRNRSRRNRK